LPYPAQVGVPLVILHPVRDINGNYVAGQAAALTKALLDPDRLAAPTELAATTLVDHAVAGWVVATFTPTRAGTWTLSLSNPDAPTADGRTEDYSILAAQGIAASATLLTSLDRVRLRLNLRYGTGDNPPAILPGQAHDLDAYLNMLISEVSDEYQATAGRTFIEQTYTEYLDGTGRPGLVLAAGPLVSVTSLNQVVYQDDGAGGVTEVLTLVPAYSYVLAGLRSQPRYTGRGRLDRIGWCWAKGHRNYKAVYVAGFAAVPEAVVGLATEDVATRCNMRNIGHLLSKSLMDGTISYLRPSQIQEMRQDILGAWRVEAA